MILDVELQISIAAVDPHPRFRRSRMPRRIAERFLDDPVDVDRAVLAHAVERAGGREVCADSGLPLELLDGAFDRAGQAEVVEHTRVQPL